MGWSINCKHLQVGVRQIPRLHPQTYTAANAEFEELEKQGGGTLVQNLLGIFFAEADCMASRVQDHQ
jgi:hypothetical protein